MPYAAKKKDTFCGPDFWILLQQVKTNETRTDMEVTTDQLNTMLTFIRDKMPPDAWYPITTEVATSVINRLFEQDKINDCELDAEKKHIRKCTIVQTRDAAHLQYDTASVLKHLGIILAKHYNFSIMTDKLWALIAYHRESPEAQDLLFELIEVLLHSEFYEYHKKINLIIAQASACAA